MNRMFGIDISRWQGDFDLAKAVKNEGVQFVIIKCGGGDGNAANRLYTDSQFKNNYNKAKQLGIPVGLYWFSRALNVTEATQEAEYCYNLIKGLKFELPLYIDVENKTQLAIGKNNLTNVIDTFCKYMEARKIYVGIYSSSSYFRTHMNDDYLKKYAHWTACWGKTQPANAPLWQFGGETNLIRSNKINGQTVDQDYLYVDYMTVIKNNGFNGYTKTATKRYEVNAGSCIYGTEKEATTAIAALNNLGFTKATVKEV